MHYFIVGCTPHNHADAIEEFVERQIWYGDSSSEQPYHLIEVGDHLFFKKNLGDPSQPIAILGYGTVGRIGVLNRDIALKIFHLDEAVRFDHEVQLPSRGRFPTVNGPYDANHPDIHKLLGAI